MSGAKNIVFSSTPSLTGNHISYSKLSFVTIFNFHIPLSTKSLPLRVIVIFSSTILGVGI